MTGERDEDFPLKHFSVLMAAIAYITIPVVPSEAARRAAQSGDLFFPASAQEKVPPLRLA
jgi:hypothetical protein